MLADPWSIFISFLRYKKTYTDLCDFEEEYKNN